MPADFSTKIIAIIHGIQIYICYYFDSELCWHNYCAMLNKFIMTLERLVPEVRNMSAI